MLPSESADALLNLQRSKSNAQDGNQTPASVVHPLMRPLDGRSRWDQAPAATPIGNQGLVTPMHPSQMGGPVMPTAFGTDISMRNAPLSDEELDMIVA